MGLSQKENEAAPKKTMAGTMKVSAKGVLLWCETKQNAGRLYSIRDWISTMPASFHRNNYPEGRPGEITQRNHRAEKVGAEWTLLAMAYNILRMHHKAQNGRLGTHLFAMKEK